jgi:hypothetical protein
VIAEVRLRVSARGRALAAALALVGGGVTAFAVVMTPERGWPNLLVGAYYLLTLSASALFFLATQRLTGARWSAGIRRIPEAFLPLLPIAALLMLTLGLGHRTLYSWSRPGAFADAPAIAGKVQYLQLPGVFARLAAAVALWGLFAWLFRRTSRLQDRAPALGLVLHRRLNRYAPAFVAVFAVTSTALAYDWLISLEHEWFSTMYGVYVFAGTFVQGIAAVTIVTALLVDRGVLRGAAGPETLHDLGKMLFAFSTFWAYVWTCQYLLIWYANIPEEVTHHLRRTQGAWLAPFAANFLVNWVVPFAVLLSASVKRRPRVLVAAAMLFLAGHWLDLYLLVMPTQWPEPKLGLPEVAAAVGCGALVYLVVTWSLARAPLVPLGDPVIAADRADRSEPS